MENNIPPTANQPAPVAPPPATTPAKKRSGWTYVLVGALVAALGAVGYLGFTNPNLFRAAITESTVQPSVPAQIKLFIPSYEASPQDSGSIAIKTKNTPASENLVSLQFKLLYTPVNALTLNENSIVFDDETLFKSADLKSVNTSTPGEAIISLFSNTPATVSGDDQKLFKLAVQLQGAPGSEITLQAQDVEAIKKTGETFEASTQFSNIAAGKISLVTQANLRALNAEAIDPTHVAVRFSDLLQSIGAAEDGPNTNYTINDLLATNVESGYTSGYDQSVVIVETDTQISGKAYTLTLQNLSDVNIVGNTQGGINPAFSKIIFYGYKDPDDPLNSPVVLSSVEANSETQLTLHFSGNLDAASITPINLVVKKLQPAEAGLTITNTELVNPTTVRLTTAQQSPDANYFVTFNGVLDAGGKPLLNNRVLNFFGFTVPAITLTSASPNTITNDVSQTIVLLGQHLDTADTVRVGTTQATIAEQTATALSLNLPAGFAEGIYDITLVSRTGGTATLEKALAVTRPERPMRIISSESRAVPNRVAPDGQTPITFWVLVEDPVGLATIDSVTIDLEKIGGNRAQEMQKDTGLQPQYRQFYKTTTTVAATTPTQTQPYSLAVQVRKGDQVANGTVSITVTRDVLGSVAPTISQAYLNPATVPPDGVTQATVSAKVTDPDGANTITSVVADMGTLGVGFIPLKPLEVAGQADEQTTGWFASDPFTVPTSTKQGPYTITITASDSTGENSSKDINVSVSSALSGPTIDAGRSYLSPRKSLPKDGKTPFSIHAMVTDPDGVSDIESVNAYFETLGLPPATLFRDPSVSATAKTALYSSAEMSIPTTAPLGAHDVEVVATDSTGGSSNVILRMEVADRDVLGDAPLVLDKKSYSAPKVAVNDGQARVTLYAFVRDDDDDLQSVVANLSGVGQVGPQTPPDFGESGAVPPIPQTGGGCPTNSATIVCMEPSFKEGRDGQWFILPNVTVSPSTPGTAEPYQIEVVATDAGGKTDRGKIPLFVRDSQSLSVDTTPPRLIAAVPTAPGRVEVVFSKEISPLSVSSNGREFAITDRADPTAKLAIAGATLDPSGNVVTLTTSSQTAGKEYVLTASGKITDLAGTALVSGPSSRLFFKTFTDSTAQPVVNYVSATDLETVDVEFQKELKPSSVKLGEAAPGSAGNFDIRIFDTETSVPLAVRAVRFSESGKLLEIKTERQQSGHTYRLQIQDVASYAGIRLREPVTKAFKAVKVTAIPPIPTSTPGQNQADLNGDGKVDFIDFTIFSSFYGQVFGGASGGAAQGLSPLIAPPPSTVPHTSVPAGGTVLTN